MFRKKDLDDLERRIINLEKNYNNLMALVYKENSTLRDMALIYFDKEKDYHKPAPVSQVLISLLKKLDLKIAADPKSIILEHKTTKK